MSAQALDTHNSMKLYDLYQGIDNTLYADRDGNINYIFWFNLPGRIIHWIKSYFDDSVERRLQDAVVTLLSNTQSNQAEILPITISSPGRSINTNDIMRKILSNNYYFQSNSDTDQRIRSLAQELIIETCEC